MVADAMAVLRAELVVVVAVRLVKSNLTGIFFPFAFLLEKSFFDLINWLL
jgi:hypothetical protein